jgi:hypothetical protein
VKISAYCSVKFSVTVEAVTSRQSLRAFFLLRPPKESPALSGTLEADVSSPLDALLSLMAAMDLFNLASYALTLLTFLLVGVIPLALFLFLISMTVSLLASDIFSQWE